MAGGLGVVEVPVRVGLQVHRELVEVLGDLVVAVEVLVEVGLAVAVEIAEDHDLVAAARRRCFPSRTFRPSGWNSPDAIRCQESSPDGASSPLDEPDIAVPGADRGLMAAVEEVEPGQPQLAEPRVVLGKSERIDGERTVVAAGLIGVFKTSGHRDGAAARERGEVRRRARLAIDRPEPSGRPCSGRERP